MSFRRSGLQRVLTSRSLIANASTARSLQRFDRIQASPPLGVTRFAIGQLCGQGSGHAVAPICTQGFLFLRPIRLASCAGHSISATSSPQRCRTSASHLASHGLIWPKDGCASIACAATAHGSTFFPWASPIPRASQESLAAAVLRCAPARRRVRRRSPSACRSPSRPRWSRHRTAKEK